jgi:hypothetical protein
MSYEFLIPKTSLPAAVHRVIAYGPLFHALVSYSTSVAAGFQEARIFYGFKPPGEFCDPASLDEERWAGFTSREFLGE